MAGSPANSHGNGYPLGLAGAVSATRYVGGTATVAPTTGTFAVGDFVIAQNGSLFVCTVAGTPGTWVQAGGPAISQVGLVLLASSRLVAPAASFDFVAIPAGYNSLLVTFVGATSDAAATTVLLRFNNDGSAVYDYERWNVSLAVGGGSETIDGTSMRVGTIPSSSVAANAGFSSFVIPEYAGTTFQKELNSTGGYGNGTGVGSISMDYFWGRWRSAAAVTRLTLTPGAGNWIAGSAAFVYGMGVV